MRKNILLFILIAILYSGLYGCSCSQQPIVEVDLPAGLYVAAVTFDEEDEGQTEKMFSVKLQRNSTETVTVNYEILATTNDSKAVAVVGSSASDASAGILDIVDALSATGTLTFDENTTDTLQIPITIINDKIYEEDEVFIVKLSSPSGASIIEGIAEITIKENDPAPTASIEMVGVADTASKLNEATVEPVSLRIYLNTVSAVEASMKIYRSFESASESNPGFSAAYRVDYMLYQNSEKLAADADITIPVGQLETLIEVKVIDDGIIENAENFEISLTAKAHVITAGATGQTFTIADNDTRDSIATVKLNDTGVFDAPGALINSAVESQVDKSLGRDSTVTVESKTGGGRVGFDFSKIASSDGGCVKDNATGLIWEVKIAGDAVERSVSRHFFWYDPNYATNGGVPGKNGRYKCEENDADAGTSCSTAYYIADMNEQALCGMTGWRMPTIDELRSIVDYGISDAVHYDTDYFSGDLIGSSYIWSSTTYANDPALAWTIRFGNVGFIEELRPKVVDDISGIRLVNDSQVQ